MKKFKSSFNVYYEDTDAGGVVYYANYLKFIERARTDAIASVNFTNSNLKENYGIYIIVKSCNLNFIKPSRLEDKLDIFSEIVEAKNVSIKLKQDIFVKENLKIVVALGKIAFDACIQFYKKHYRIDSNIKFGHSKFFKLPNNILLVGSYHPSPRNVNTGRINVNKMTNLFIKVKNTI